MYQLRGGLLMRRLSTLLLTFGLALLIATPAFAQRQRGQGQGRGQGRGAGNPVAMLLNNESVQKELKFDEDKLKAIEDDYTKASRELGGGRGRQGGGGGTANADKRTALRKETMEKIQSVLTEEQKKTWKDMTGEPFQVRTAGRRGGQQDK